MSEPAHSPAPATPSAPRAAALEHTRITHRLARLVLAAFLFTFIIARILVIMIMAHKLPPQLFFHVSGTHVHHLNYGIILLSVAGAFLLFQRPTGKALSAGAVIYGIGLALTFDEFGMWLHLGGYYWQRASFDAMVVIAAVLALIAFGSTITHWRPHHHATIVLLLIALCLFGFAIHASWKWGGLRLETMLEHLEQQGPS